MVVGLLPDPISIFALFVLGAISIVEFEPDLMISLMHAWLVIMPPLRLLEVTFEEQS